MPSFPTYFLQRNFRYDKVRVVSYLLVFSRCCFGAGRQFTYLVKTYLFQKFRFQFQEHCEGFR